MQNLNLLLKGRLIKNKSIYVQKFRIQRRGLGAAGFLKVSMNFAIFAGNSGSSQMSCRAQLSRTLVSLMRSRFFERFICSMQLTSVLQSVFSSFEITGIWLGSIMSVFGSKSIMPFAYPAATASWAVTTLSQRRISLARRGPNCCGKMRVEHASGL